VTKLRYRVMIVLLPLIGFVSTGCTQMPARATPTLSNNPTTTTEPSTILLVGLKDGSFVRQTVSLGAEICVKDLNDPKTTCLKQGDAITNSQGVVVGYRMISETIDLQGVNSGM